MWDILDFRDLQLVQLKQRELWDQAAKDRLARTVRNPRPSPLGALAARLGWRRPSD